MGTAIPTTGYTFARSRSNYEDISLKYDYKDSSDKDVVGVLVLGESARYSNFGINGYERETTPHLNKVDNLVNYKSIACSNNTYLSVPCMLSRFDEKDLAKVEKETSVLSVLTKMGFDTLWMGTQSITKYYRNKPGGSFYDEVKFHMIPGGSLVFLPNDLDEKMLFPEISVDDGNGLPDNDEGVEESKSLTTGMISLGQNVEPLLPRMDLEESGDDENDNDVKA